ncbi:DUF2281 domain-containing protein [Synechococcales cyanobacterium C]|uniref:DUF2281 domain-containing protein n=1 Tax=Petrachloros mirabilis ULC683 TaxID=2781853 RepID=A0A8K2AGY0_9CYAN|nr:DUF2281 domain-containing protein [Petrachloros mirabilis]NCJ05730.1 DUF2281 domain-containing protein [Petrachloros mirabilis ULC683]
MIQTVILQKLEALPESLQAKVFHYIDFLSREHHKNKEMNLDDLRKPWIDLPDKEAEKQYGYGSMAGKIIMADDFDEPLEELSEYM